MVPGSSGGRAGQIATIDEIPPVTGLISQEGKTLVLVAGLTPTVETETYSNGDVWRKICHRARVLINLSN
jgi:hypothetical protein